MDIKQETMEVETPGGYKLVARAYLTGEDRRADRRLFLKMADETPENKADSLDQAENHRIKQIILSVNGEKENVLETVLKMPVADYDFVVDLVARVAGGLDEKKNQT